MCGPARAGSNRWRASGGGVGGEGGEDSQGNLLLLANAWRLPMQRDSRQQTKPRKHLVGNDQEADTWPAPSQSGRFPNSCRLVCPALPGKPCAWDVCASSNLPKQCSHLSAHRMSPCRGYEDRGHSNSVIPQRVLHEVYLAPFEAAVREADVQAVMRLASTKESKESLTLL